MLKDLALPLITALGIYSGGEKGNTLLPLEILFPISLLGHVRALIVDVVNDKAEKYKEYLKINGVSSSAYFTSTLLFGYFKCIVFTVITCAGFLFRKGTDLPTALSFFSLYFFVGLACTHFALFLTTFFSNKQLCSDIGGLLFTLLSFMNYAALQKASKFWYYLSLLFPQNILSYAVNTLNKEQDINLPLNNKTYYSFIFLDMALYLVFFLYLDQIMPDSYGVKKKWYFCLEKLFKRRRNNEYTSVEQVSFVANDSNARLGLLDSADMSSAIHHENFSNPEGYKRSVIIEHISKSFGSEQVISDLSLMIYEKQVFCLLGHNGAGKTTTINILTGILSHDKGDVYYYDQSFHKNMDKLRRYIGLCGQQDILYGDITTREHLEMFGRIRGLSGHSLEIAIEHALEKANLMNEADKLARTLSGGNQRKLSLALAIIGGSSIIFLDEPTSGMDPSSRRMIWDIIKQLREDGKTILLTTHHLDEADELADRLAIMSKGKLFALGSSEFIKKKFGVGYHLVITPDYETSNLEKFIQSRDLIFDTISEILDIRREEQKSNESLKFLLPFTQQKNFSRIFEELEKIEGIKLNLQMNSLEDAFINIGLQEEALFNPDYALQTQIQLNTKIPNYMVNTPSYSFCFQFEAMFLRKYFFFFRNFNNVLLLVLPVAFVIIGTMFTAMKIQKEGGFSEDDREFDTVKTFLFLFLVNFAYSLNITIYCSFSVYERENKIKYALRVMGCRTLPYWLGTFAFDFIAIHVINFALIALVYIFSIDHLMEQVYTLAFTIFPYSVALITSSYLWGFAFEKSLTVYKSFAAFYFFVLYVLPSIVYNLAAVFSSSKTLITAIQWVIYLVCPIFGFNDAIMYFIFGDVAKDLPIGLFLSSNSNCIKWLWMIAALYMVLTIILEIQYYKINLSKLRPYDINADYEAGTDTSEILNEASRVQSPGNNDRIKVLHLRKTYSNGYTAVKDLSFGVGPGEIFGLLGPNGAGKSTTFNITTAMIPRTGGDIELMGTKLDENLGPVFTELGICPQFNPLWDDLKVDEHLYIYAKIKGISRINISDCINFMMNSLGMREHMKKRANILSGGTKRKLCVGLALIGSPLLQFMDEPSTGLDPMAKRHLWSCLSNIAHTRRSSVMLTTHSMEEAEALCHKIGIIVNGKFICFGPLNYLKNKYGSGYKLTLSKFNAGTDASNYIQQLFPDAQKVIDNQTLSETYQIPNHNFVFSKAFRALEDLKRSKIIQDFSIYNTTLEQVFINFSKRQQEPIFPVDLE